MPSNEEILEAVASIESPLLPGRSLGELGLVKSAERKLAGKVKVDLLLPNANPEDALNDRLQHALEPFGRGADVTVEVMTDQMATEWMAGLRKGAGPALGEPGSPTRVLAVSSGKGGVGKSSVSANLAVSLRSAGHRVGIVDGDIWGFSTPACSA